MIAAVVLSLALQASDQETAQRFCQALTSSEIRSFIPLAAKTDDLSVDPWASVRDLFEHYDCISIPSYEVTRQADWIVIDIEGSGITHNARHERRAIPRLWYVRAGRGIAEVKQERDFVIDALIAAPDDDARRVIVQEHEAVFPAAAFLIANMVTRTDRNRLPATSLFLLQWSQARDDFATESYALIALARLAHYAGDVKTASRLTDAAQATARVTNDCDVIAYADYNATPYLSPEMRGRVQESVIASAEWLDDPFPVLHTLMSRGGERFSGSDFRRAYLDDQTLLELSQRFGSRDGELQARQFESVIRRAIHDWDGTIETALKTGVIAHEQLNAEFQARSCYVIGATYAERTPPDYARAVPWLQRAVDRMPPTFMRTAIFKTDLGDALVHAGRLQEAEQYLKPALAGGRDTDYLVKAYAFAEHLRYAQGRVSEAMELAQLGINAGRDDLHAAWELKADVGRMNIECGDVENGIEDLREAIDLIETRRVLNTADAMVRARYFAARQWVYASLLDVLAGQKRFGEAFIVAEQMKARALDDSFAGESQRFPLTAAELSQRRALNQRVVDLNRKVIASKGAARDELGQARIDLETFNAGMAVRYSKSVIAQSAAVPLDVAGAVIEYAVLPDSVVVFVIRNGRVTGTPLKVRRSTIERDAARFTASIRKRDLDYAPKARTLYDELIRPVAQLVTRGEAVTIVPDGFLWNVPFDALMTPSGRFLIEEHALAYAPSVMMLDDAARHRRTSSAGHELLAVGDPFVSASTRKKATVYRDLSLGALPDAAREARAVAELYGRSNSKVLTHATAREAAVKELAPAYRIIHLATHGIVDDQSPLYSALVLASDASDREDGLLEMREVRDLDLHADLIVLSACDTARGTVYPGEGVIGLSWAFLTSGCPTTVVSQWNVESRSTSELMIDFHRRLLAGANTAAALRSAKLAVMRDHRYAHPLYWAPFIVVGDGASKIR